MIKLDIINGDFYLPEINLWLDSQQKRDFSFVSHAHMDHVKNHKVAICSMPTRHFLKVRSKIKSFKSYEYLQSFFINDHKLTLHPSGHILGSSMLLIEYKGDSLLFTGDVKVNSSYSSEEINIPNAKTLITEASFGTEKFVFPKRENLLAQLDNAISSSETPVIFTYSLGKSQEILMMLKQLKYNKPLFVHENIRKLNKTYESFNYEFPEFNRFPNQFEKGAIYILPVHFRHHKIFKNKDMTPIYTTGWALDSEKRKVMKCDICLPISDHAGFD